MPREVAVPATPVEQPDDLLSVTRVISLPFLREIQGDLTAQNIFLNDTPLANDSGEYNFSGVKWEFRKGTWTGYCRDA